MIIIAPNCKGYCEIFLLNELINMSCIAPKLIRLIMQINAYTITL